MALTISVAAAQAEGVALASTIGASSTIKIYSGAKPATPETAASGTLLVNIPIAGSFTSTGGVLTSADPAAVAPAASGTAGWFRVATSGAVAVIDGTVGVSAADMILGSTTITTGVNVDLGIPTFTVPTL